MDEGSASETVPDLRDIEVKIGRKTPEGLLRWMREEATPHRGDAKPEPGKETGRKSLDEKIRKLKVEMAHLRSVDVKILQQLLAVHEGIEAVKWLLEERSTLTSRCSSLTSSQYSLGEGPDTSWRGSWSSLHDPNDKLDNISIGSYLDTLADDMDEYCPSSSESVIGPSAPLEAGAGGRTGGGAAVAAATAGVKPCAGAGGGAGTRTNENGKESKSGAGAALVSDSNGTESAGSGTGKAGVAMETKQDAATARSKAAEAGKGQGGLASKAQGGLASKANGQPAKANGVSEKPAKQGGSPAHRRLGDKPGPNQSPKLKPYKNGKVDLDSCKINGKMHLEYDAHWRWVQSQEDVTFL